MRSFAIEEPGSPVPTLYATLGLMVGDGTWRSVMLDDKSDDNRNDHEIHLIDENDDALKGVLGFGW